MLAVPGFWRYVFPYPSAESLYQNPALRRHVEGVASASVIGKGSEQLKITGNDGKAYFIDCIAAPTVCTGGRYGKQIAVSADVIWLGGGAYWPAKAMFQTGEKIDESASEVNYAHLIEKRMRFGRTWLIGSFLALVGALVLGNVRAFKAK